MSEIKDVWEKHTLAWRNCLRCPLRHRRIISDTSRRPPKDLNKVPMGRNMGAPPTVDESVEAPTPAPIFALASHVDDLMERFGRMVYLSDDEADGATGTASILGLAIEDLSSNLPYRLDSFTLDTALGCRAVSPFNARDNIDVKSAHLRACRNRWVQTVIVTQPRIVIAFGREALDAAIQPASKTNLRDHLESLGEILQMDITVDGRSARLPVYVGPDLHHVDMHVNDEQLNRPFTFMPTRTPTSEPWDNLRWHLYRASWLARILDAPDCPEAISRWEGINKALSDFHSEIEGGVAARMGLIHTIENIRGREQGGGVRRYHIESMQNDVSTEPPEDQSDAQGDEDDYEDAQYIEDDEQDDLEG